MPFLDAERQTADKAASLTAASPSPSCRSILILCASLCLHACLHVCTSALSTRCRLATQGLRGENFLAMKGKGNLVEAFCKGRCVAVFFCYIAFHLVIVSCRLYLFILFEMAGGEQAKTTDKKTGQKDDDLTINGRNFTTTRKWNQVEHAAG